MKDDEGAGREKAGAGPEAEVGAGDAGEAEGEGEGDGPKPGDVGKPGEPVASRPPRETLRPETLAARAGYDPSAGFRAVKPPLALTSTFSYPSAAAAKAAHAAFFDGADARPPFIYARLDHPGLATLEERMALLDGAEASAGFASGMAAIAAVLLAHLRPGDSLLHTAPLYGGTHSLMHGLIAEMGVTPVAIADPLDRDAIAAAAATARTHGPLRLVMIETPANPTAGLSDIALMAEIARADGERPVVAVDNTLLGPLGQRPLQHGADLTITSLTKYAGGHSDVLGGAVSGSTARIKRLRALRTGLGTHLDPFSCFLILRSLETLALRVERAAASAREVAGFLRGHPKVAAVTYLGFAAEEGPARAVFARQCHSAGSTFSFKIRGGEDEAFRMLDRLQLIEMAVSLGGSETLICHSATTTHYAVPADVRAAVGVDASSLRISVGLEHPEDLIADLAQALEAI